MSRIAVIGAGSVGQMMAGHLAQKGFCVSLFDIDREIVEGIRKRENTVTYEGVVSGQGKIECVSDDLEKVMEGAGWVMVATLTANHSDVAGMLAPYLTARHLVVLHPGGTFGALAFRAALSECGFCGFPVIAECQDAIYTCRSISPGVSRVLGIKKNIALSTIPANEANRVAEELNAMLPHYRAVPNTIYTSLGNLAPVTHPGPAILNAAKIETQKNPFPYLETITPSVARLVEKVDDERRMIAAALGVELISHRQWMFESYGIVGADTYECYRNARVYSELKAQTDVKTRYITEDVPCGLVPMAAVARAVGVSVPAIDALVTLCGIITCEDYEKTGRNLQSLGLSGGGAKELLSIIQ